MVARVVKRRARAVMVLGTGSSVGKSAMVAALCRHLARNGVRVAPFKAQNMSLNSAATPEGLEIGRAQALQAEAAGIAPSVDHNPVLIKPTSDTGAQAIVNGRIWGRLDASDYGGTTKRLFWPFVVEAYERLAAKYDTIVIEGAGSPAEINLRAGDIVNMAVAHLADARCVLVGDIDRGGVFASIFGTLALLDEADQARIDGWLVNKFRGNLELLRPGIAMLEERIGKPCYGVVPHLGDLGLDEEDGVSLDDPRRAPRAWRPTSERRLRIAVVRLPHLANFTDFDALHEEPSVDLRYVASATELDDAAVVILPGSKDTIADLAWLRERGLAEPIAAAARDRVVVGICAGMQLLGRHISDPHGVESGGTHEGLGILDLVTTLAAEKVTVPVLGRFGAAMCGGVIEPVDFHGYEIHTGVTEYGAGLAPFAEIVRNGRTGDPSRRRDRPRRPRHRNVRARRVCQRRVSSRLRSRRSRARRVGAGANAVAHRERSRATARSPRGRGGRLRRHRRALPRITLRRRAMKRGALVALAAMLDAAFGDSPSLPHPVRAIGAAIAAGEPLARDLFPDTPVGKRNAGALLAISIVAATYATTALAARLPGLEALAAASSLALRDLLDHVRSVLEPLQAGDLAMARVRLARVVGRDTVHLGPSEIARAVIETLAESACDGVVAPLFYLTLGGAPAALAYKAVNTLGFGHRTY